MVSLFGNIMKQDFSIMSDQEESIEEEESVGELYASQMSDAEKLQVLEDITSHVNEVMNNGRLYESFNYTAKKQISFLETFVDNMAYFLNNKINANLFKESLGLCTCGPPYRLEIECEYCGSED